MANPSIEFSSLIYGSLVNSLLETADEVDEVNSKLDEIGWRIGLRLAHEFARDRTLERVDTPEKIINDLIIKNWVNITGSKNAVQCTETKKSQYLLTFEQSIFTQNVTIPERYNGLKYTAVLPGIIRGIFEIYHFEAKVYLKEKSTNTEEIVEMVKEIPIAVPKDDN